MEHFIVTQISHHGYLAIFVMMILESACVPIPSEAIMLFGGALAGGLTVAGVHVRLNIVGVALAGTAGNLVGALVAYAVGRVGGRPLIERWGRYLLIRPKELDRADQFFARRGSAAILIGRVVPVVRTFISLPAGIAEVPIGAFGLLTVVGTLPWTFGLAGAGESLASNWSSVSKAFTTISIAIGYRWLRVDAVFAFWAAYIVTRPLGASIADGLGKAKDLSGVGYGDGTVAIVFAALIAVGVVYLAISKVDVQAAAAVP